MRFCYFLNEFFANFRKFSGVRGGGPRPRTLTRRTPQRVPTQPKSWRRRWFKQISSVRFHFFILLLLVRYSKWKYFILIYFRYALLGGSQGTILGSRWKAAIYIDPNPTPDSIAQATNRHDPPPKEIDILFVFWFFLAKCHL